MQAEIEIFAATGTFRHDDTNEAVVLHNYVLLLKTLYKYNKKDTSKV